MKKKIVFPKYSKVTSVFAAVFLAIGLVILILEKLNTYIYLFGVSNEEILSALRFLFFVFFINALAVFLYQNIKFKIVPIILTTIISLAVFCSLTFLAVFSSDNKYHEFSSDDNKHEIVVNECAILLAGYGSVYEKNSFCTMKRVGGYGTDDGFLPFTFDCYYFVWNENDFELHYDYGNGSDTYSVITFDYIK